MASYFVVAKEATPTTPRTAWTRRLALGATLSNVEGRLRRNKGPYKLFNFRDGQWSARIKRDGAIAGLKERLRKDQIGDAERVRCGNGAVIRVRRVKPLSGSLPPTLVDCHPQIQEIYRSVRDAFSGAQDWGGQVCRRNTANWAVWSQHAYGRAWDVHPASMAQGDAIRRFVDENWGGRTKVFWRVRAHFDHLHIELTPAGTGTPPCAR